MKTTAIITWGEFLKAGKKVRTRAEYVIVLDRAIAGRVIQKNEKAKLLATRFPTAAQSAEASRRLKAFEASSDKVAEAMIKSGKHCQLAGLPKLGK